jgi:multisubunit Na+/H+ antiporter MnhB subunit
VATEIAFFVVVLVLLAVAVTRERTPRSRDKIPAVLFVLILALLGMLFLILNGPSKPLFPYGNPF